MQANCCLLSWRSLLSSLAATCQARVAPGGAAAPLATAESAPAVTAASGDTCDISNLWQGKNKASSGFQAQEGGCQQQKNRPQQEAKPAENTGLPSRFHPISCC
mmetsp:Transcript_1364/g.2119  ORF Transcript_1364/g.2119 Transcript_1364/m.2119 type:complete len:104 (+) Transcript_1364:798-1109(+)